MMGDVASPNALYPAAPQQPQAATNLLANPGQAIGILSGLQDYRLKQQQFDSLAQQPAAALQGQNISNATAEMVQQEAASRAVSRIMGGYLAGIPKPTSDDVRSAAAFAARSLPNVAIKYPDIISAASETGRKNPGLLINSGLSPEAQSGEVAGGPGPNNAPTVIKTPASNMTPARVVGAAPGVNEAQVQTGAGSGAALNEARHRGLNYRQEVFPLETAIPALEKLGKTGTGPGTEEFNHIKSFLQSAGIPGLDTDKIKTFDEAKKYLTDFVNQNGNTGTNDKLAASFAGNPSVGISNAAAVDVAKSALALRRMKQAQLIEFEKSGLPDSEFTKWASRWQLGHDPRAFGFDLMTPEQRKKVVEGFPEGKDGKPGPRDLFKLQVQEAHNAGIINPNGLGQ